MIRSMFSQHAFCLILSLLLGGLGGVVALAQPTTQPSSQPDTQPTDPWRAELDALDQPIDLPSPRVADSHSFTRHISADVPRSLITLNAIHLPNGRSNGFSADFDGSAGEYAAYLMSLPIDQLFECTDDQRAVELASRLAGGKMRFGASRVVPEIPDLSLLPDWLLPLPKPDFRAVVAREFQLTAQRLDDAGNFSGIVVVNADREACVSLSDRLRDIAPHWIITPGDFDGSTLQLSGESLFSHLAVQQVHDWNGHRFEMPLWGVSLIDRLRSYHPHKQTWAIIDNHEHKLSREVLHRAYAMALTRGIDAIGINWLPLPGDGEAAKRVTDLQEIHQWTHRLGGVYGITEPIPSVGILYVHQQALRKPQHLGMTYEAMALCHAAGFPSRIITPEELRRGLPEAMKAVLLVGLDRVEEEWVWFHDLEDSLRAYADRGGRFVIDEPSVAPVPAIKPGLTMHAWFEQPVPDALQRLLERNQKNISHLREALADIARPIAYSDDPLLWVIPTLAGNVEYVTVVNAQTEAGEDGRQIVPPRTSQIEWTSSRPVYDVRTRRKLSAEEARTVDLTTEPFRLYALPPVEPPSPSIHVEVDEKGCFIARVTSGEVQGLPIEVTISRQGLSETIYRVTGESFRLPLQIYDEPGEYDIAVTELVTGQSENTRVVVPANAPPPPAAGPGHLSYFAGRKSEPLVIALTDAQLEDAEIVHLAARLAAHFRSLGRAVSVAPISPHAENGVVLSSQPARTTARPRWQTRSVDLVLLGTPRDNVLIRDQALGRLLPPAVQAPELRVTWSPFAPDRHVLNLLGDGTAALTVLVEQVEREVR